MYKISYLFHSAITKLTYYKNSLLTTIEKGANYKNFYPPPEKYRVTRKVLEFYDKNINICLTW